MKLLPGVREGQMGRSGLSDRGRGVESSHWKQEAKGQLHDEQGLGGEEGEMKTPIPPPKLMGGATGVRQSDISWHSWGGGGLSTPSQRQLSSPIFLF